MEDCAHHQSPPPVTHPSMAPPQNHRWPPDGGHGRWRTRGGTSRGPTLQRVASMSRATLTQSLLPPQSRFRFRHAPPVGQTSPHSPGPTPQRAGLGSPAVENLKRGAKRCKPESQVMKMGHQLQLSSVTEDPASPW